MQRAMIGLAFLLAGMGCRKDVDGMDFDGDGVTARDGDCGPGDPATYPDAPEVCDGHDNNCDSIIDNGVGTPWFTDADGDGFGDDATSLTACFPPAGSVPNGGDCDDDDVRVNPAAIESCDVTADIDCDGTTSGEDADGDGFVACQDCDDDDDAVNPDADEVCGGADEDCDGDIDEDDATDAVDFFVDLDGDGTGSDRLTVTACEAPNGFVAAADDCDDLHAQSYPSAPELCDGLDNDCNGTLDDGAADTVTYWADSDKDGFGDPSAEVSACVPPAGYTDNDDDCNDADAKFNPEATESCSDPSDYNCDGSVGQADGDLDGTPACTDCDDGNAAVEPGAPEICDGLDNDCNGQTDETAPTWYADVDGDGHGGTQLTVVSCTAPGGFVTSTDDCDDLHAAAYTGATEACDGLDGDCSGAPDADEADADGDHWRGCEGDCDDAEADAHPGRVEVCDAVDNDCDGTPDDAALDGVTAYTDADSDAYGTGAASIVCALASGQSTKSGDCDDAAASVNPSATELCNAKDDDCDTKIDVNAVDQTRWFADADGDKFGAAAGSKLACAQPAGYVTLAGDCDDTKSTVSPVMPELCSSVVDDDCDGSVNEADAQDAVEWFQDRDSDGHGSPFDFTLACTNPGGRAAVADDCNDTNNKVFGGASAPAEIWYDGVDQNCDGRDDYDQDGDGYVSAKFAGGTDCDDTKSTIVACNSTCATILAANPGAASGPYLLDPQGDGTGFDTWCDMTRDGGGWTLVLQNNTGVSTVARGNLSWAEATGSRSVIRGGTMTSWAGQGAFDIWVGLSNWNAIGTRARIEVGPSVNNPSRQALFDISLGAPSTNYTLNLSNLSVTLGGITPDIFAYHNGRPLTTYDRDNDSWPGNCSNNYQHPFWYRDCWAGSLWGSDIGGYQPSPYWTGSGGDYYTWGAIWIR